MKKHLLFLFILISVFVNAQNPESFYLNSNLPSSSNTGSTGYKFTSDAIYFNYDSIGMYSSYFVTVKTDYYGNVIWRKNNTGLLEATDEKSLYFIRQYPTPSILIKTDTSGNTIWAKSLSSTCLASGSLITGFVLNKNRIFISDNHGYIGPNSVLTLDTSGNVINSWCDNEGPIIGEGYSSLMNGAWFVFQNGAYANQTLWPFDANGNPETSIPHLIMVGTIQIEDVIPMADSTYLAIGNHYACCPGQTNSDNYVSISKFDRSGSVIWQKDLHDADGDTTVDTAYIAVAAAVDSANNIYIVGVLDNHTYHSYLLIKLDSSGYVMSEVEFQNLSTKLGMSDYYRLHYSNGILHCFAEKLNRKPAVVVLDTAFQTICYSIPTPITLPWHNDTLYTSTWLWPYDYTATFTAPNTSLNFSNGTASTSNLCLVLGVNDISRETFQAFPNPFTNQIVVRSSEFLVGDIILYDLMGKEMLHEKVRGDGIELNTDKLPSGFYVLHYSNGKSSTNLKVIKQ